MLEMGTAQQLKGILLNASRTGDLGLYKEAQEKGISFSAALEELDPSPETSKTDAFQRQMMLFDLIGPAHREITVENFYTNSAMILLPEFVQRHVSEGYRMNYNPDNLVATVVPVKGPTVHPIYIRTTEAEKSLGIKSGGASFPRSTLFYREKDTAVKDKGRVFDFEYKVIRNMQLQEFKTYLNYVGAHIASDQLDEIYNIIENGDGTSSGATDVFAGTGGTLAFSDVLTLGMSFEPPVAMTHILANQTDMETLLGLSEYKDPEVWLAMQKIPKEDYTGLLPLNAKLVIAPNATTNKLAALDSRFCIRKSVAQPLMIEAEKVIDQKMEEAVISEESVYTIMLDDAAYVSDFAA